jgi:tetratricopeptide (TPR) repeat protein
VLNNLGEVLRAWGHDDAALPLLERALDVISSHHSDAALDASAVPALTNLAALHRDAGRYAQAEELYRKVRTPTSTAPKPLTPTSSRPLGGNIIIRR